MQAHNFKGSTIMSKHGSIAARASIFVLAAFCGAAPRPARAEIKPLVDRTIMAVLDSRTTVSGNWQSTTLGSVNFYDPNVDMNKPMFSGFVGWDVEPTIPVDPGDPQDPQVITVDPNRGDVYVLSTDTPGNYAFSVQKLSFAQMYYHWLNNGGSTTTVPEAAYRMYGDQQSDQHFMFNAVNPTALPGSAVNLVSGLERNQNGNFYDYFSMEFVDENTLLVMDNAAASPVLAADDVAIRSFIRDPSSGEWSSHVLGYLNMDGIDGSGNLISASDPTQMAVVDKDGVLGVWVAEYDGAFTNPDTQETTPRHHTFAFFEINNLEGSEGNGFRSFRVGDNPLNLPTRFILDENPLVDASSNDGETPVFWVDNDGNLVIIEKGYNDAAESNGTHDPPNNTYEPKVITRVVSSYNYAGPLNSTVADEVSGVIDFGEWQIQQLDVAGAGLFDDDGTFAATSLAGITDDRWAAYDPITDKVYFMDNDGSTSPGGYSDPEVYVLDLNTGETSLAPNGQNALLAWLEVDGFGMFHFRVGDFDGSGDYSAGDVDAMFAAIAAYAESPDNFDGRFDLNADGGVDQADFDLLVGTADTIETSLMGTKLGDANLDGRVGRGDLAALAKGFGSASGWGEGDQNGDGIASLLDLAVIHRNLGFDNGIGSPSPNPSAVPEPSAWLLFAAGVGSLAVNRRRRDRRRPSGRIS
jgi:hypothetical protein